MKTTRNCLVPGCKSNSDSDVDMHYFCFPKNLNLSNQWTTNMNITEIPKDKPVSRHLRICSLHFEDSCFQNSCKDKLNRNALPTILDAKQGTMKAKAQSSESVALSGPSDSASERIPQSILAEDIAAPVPRSLQHIQNKTRIQDCLVPGCKSKSDSDVDMHFFCFPKNSNLCNQWTTNMNITDISKDKPVSRHLRICPLHFEDSCFQNSCKEKLNRNAIPTILNTKQETIKVNPQSTESVALSGPFDSASEQIPQSVLTKDIATPVSQSFKRIKANTVLQDWKLNGSLQSKNKNNRSFPCILNVGTTPFPGVILTFEENKIEFRDHSICFTIFLNGIKSYGQEGSSIYLILAQGQRITIKFPTEAMQSLAFAELRNFARDNASFI